MEDRKRQAREAGLWAAAIFAAVCLVDAILVFTVVVERVDSDLLAGLVAQAFLQSLATFGALAALWGAIGALAFVLAGTQRRDVVATSATLFGVILSFNLLTHHNYLLGAHWTSVPLRIMGVIPVLLLAILYGVRPAWFRGSRILGRLVLLSACLALVGAAYVFGTTFVVVTPKYAKETVTQAILICLQLALAGFILCGSPPRPRSGAGIAIVGVGVFLAAVAAANGLSERSRAVVGYGLEATRSLRYWNRNAASLLATDPLPWLRTYAGERDDPGFGTVSLKGGDYACRQAHEPRVRSVLLVVIDSLRFDRYGVAWSEIPTLARLRAQAIQFDHAYQPSTGTVGSAYGMLTGRYLISPQPPFISALPLMQDGLGLIPISMRQAPKQELSGFTDRLLAEMRSAISANKGFVAYAHYMSLHLPGRQRLGYDYEGVLKEIDFELKRVLDLLVATGRDADTMLIVTADHGDELREERGFVGHGYAPVETVVHVPLWLILPGAAAEVREEYVSGVDVFPTALDALGAECSLPIHGTSLLRSLPPNRPLFTTSMQQVPQLPNTTRNGDLHAVLCRPWKLVFDRWENTFSLYQVEADPGETLNRIDEHDELATELKAILQGYLEHARPERAGRAADLVSTESDCAGLPIPAR